MRTRTAVAGGVIGLTAIGGIWLAAHGHGQQAQAAPAHTTRQGVELTVYAQDFGMVHETRPVSLQSGGNRLHLPDVSKTLDPQTVLLKWHDANANSPQILAHAYDLGVADGDSLLKRYLGQEVDVVRYGQDGHEAERLHGTLMVQGNNEVVLESGGKFYVHPEGTIVAPTNNDIVTIPQLSVQADSAAAQSANLEVTYMTRGLSWSADYVATLPAQGDTMDLQGYATVVNRTGVDYPNAKVSLIAGTPNRAVESAEQKQEMLAQRDYSRPAWGRAPASGGISNGGKLAGMAKQGIAPETAGEGYTYNLSKPTTVIQEQMNRLLMLGSDKVTVKKDYNTRPPELAPGDSEYNWGPHSATTRGNVQVALAFFNKEKEGLGQPLPAGAIRLYEPDKSGTLRYAGAGEVQDTPKDQKINLTLSRAFDVFTEWRLTKREKVGKHIWRKTVEMTLHNEKTQPIALRLVQSLEGRWKVVHETAKSHKLNASETQWTVPVPANGTTVLTYTVEFHT